MTEIDDLARRLHLDRPPKLLRTICEVLREIGRDAVARRDWLTLHRVEEATEMAKRMQHKLMFYNEREKASSIVDVDGVTGNAPRNDPR